jgi:peptide/nickel transport system permease protein
MEREKSLSRESGEVKKRLKKEHRQLLRLRVLSNKSLVIGGAVLIVICLVTIFGPLFLDKTPYAIHPGERLTAPCAEFPFGTDNMGRDLLSRVVYGARVSLFVGFLAAGIAAVVGLVIGLYASYYRALDHILMRICDGLMAFPAMLLALAIMAVLGANAMNVITAVSVVMIPAVARVIRSAALVIKEQTFIEAIRSQGASPSRIIWRHIAPNVVSHLIVQATYIFCRIDHHRGEPEFHGRRHPRAGPELGKHHLRGQDLHRQGMVDDDLSRVLPRVHRDRAEHVRGRAARPAGSVHDQLSAAGSGMTVKAKGVRGEFRSPA